MNKNENLTQQILGYCAGFGIALAASAIGVVLNHFFKNALLIPRILVLILLIALFFINLILYLRQSKKAKKISDKNGQETIDFVFALKKQADENPVEVRTQVTRRFRLSVYYAVFIFILILSNLILISGFGAVYVIPVAILFTYVCGNYLSNILIRRKKEQTAQEGYLVRGSYAKLYAVVDEILAEEHIKKEVLLYDPGNADICILEYKNRIEIGIGLQAVMMLKREELKAVLYHEIAHYENEDTKIDKQQNVYAERVTLMYSANPITQILLFPTAPMLFFDREAFRHLSTIHAERRADAKLLKTGLAQSFVNALAKSIAYNIYEKSLTNYHPFFAMDELPEDIPQRIHEEFIRFYRENEGYILHAFYHSVPPRISTHPEANERMKALHIERAYVDFETGDPFTAEIRNLCRRYNKYILPAAKEQHKNMRKDYLAYLEKAEAFEKNPNQTHEQKNDMMVEYCTYGDFEKSLRLAEELAAEDETLTRAKFYAGYLYACAFHSKQCIPFLKGVISDGSGEFLQSAGTILADFYIDTGDAEGLAELRANQATEFDQSKVYEKLSELTAKDKLLPVGDRASIQHVIELVQAANCVSALAACVKEQDNMRMIHVIVAYRKDAKPEDMDRIHHAIWAYLDVVDDPDHVQYMLRNLTYEDRRYAQFLKPFVVYPQNGTENQF